MASRRAARTIEVREKENRALELKKKGATYAEIAEAVGYASAGSAHDAVMRALGREPAANREAIRRIELSKIDAVEKAAWAVLEAHHFVVEHTKDDVVIVRHPESDEYLADSGPVLAAIDRVLKCSEQRRRILGIDAPRKAQVTVLTEDVVDAAIRQLEEELASVEPGP